MVVNIVSRMGPHFYMFGDKEVLIELSVVFDLNILSELYYLTK